MQSTLQYYYDTAKQHGLANAKAFHTAFKHLVDSEQGYQKDPKDRGNWTSGRIGVGINKGTNFGVSAMTYPHLDIEKLTWLDAQVINYVDWWLQMQCDEMPPTIAFHVYDAAYHHGQPRSAIWIQEVVGVAADGYIGPITIEAINRNKVLKMSLGFNHLRLTFMTFLSGWKRYGKGWARRIANNLIVFFNKGEQS